MAHAAYSLTKYLGIKDWLYRSINATVTAGASIDNPKFSSDVFIKFNGTGSYTYTFPPGTDLLTLSGYYSLQETLSINFTSKPKVADKFDVVSLPVGGEGFNGNRATILVHSTATILEDQQTSLQQIRQQLQNLRSINQ